MPFYLMKNSVQRYAWGSPTTIPRLLGLDNPGGEPVAELWMGTHPDGPSRVDRDGREISLAQLISDNPVAVLGDSTVRRFGARLPFLFKVLAAQRALSIQVHPSRRDAEAGYARENRAGLAPDDPRRNYKDPNHKPELLCALEEFWGLCGFRRVDQIYREFTEPELAVSAAAPLLDALRSSDQESAAHRAFLQTVLNYPADQSDPLMSAALRLAQRRDAELSRVIDGPPRPADARYRWVMTLASQYPADRGALAPLFLQLFTLAPGQALYIGAGTPHSYLRGCAVELMANSNNVLRGGLTSKAVDVVELLRILDASACGPRLLHEPAPRVLHSRNGVVAGRQWDYAAPADEFRLQRLEIETDDSVVQQRPERPEIALCRRGHARFCSPTCCRTIGRGESVMITADETEYTISGPAEIYLATVGL